MYVLTHSFILYYCRVWRLKSSPTGKHLDWRHYREGERGRQQAENVGPAATHGGVEMPDNGGQRGGEQRQKESVGGKTNCGAENQEGQIKGRRWTKGRTKEGSVEDAEGSREAEAAEHCLPFTTRLWLKYKWWLWYFQQQTYIPTESRCSKWMMSSVRPTILTEYYPSCLQWVTKAANAHI